MTFNEFWQSLCVRNPDLADEKTEALRIKVDSLRKLLRQAYDAGHDKGMKHQKGLDDFFDILGVKR